MVEKGADEIIHRVYIIIRKKRKKKTPQKIKCFSQNIKKQKKTKKKLVRIFVSKLSVLFSRVTPHYIVVAPSYYSKRNGARAANDYYIQNVQNSI